MGRAEAHRGDHKPTPLQVIVDAMNLHAHTCHIMSNAKVFNPAEDFNSMTLVHIFETTLEIYTRLYEANSIRVGDDPLLARERLELGNFAQVAADRLPALQDLAKRQFKKLRRTPSKFWYWASKAVALKDAIKAWRESERKRFAPIACANKEDFAASQEAGENGSRLNSSLCGQRVVAVC